MKDDGEAVYLWWGKGATEEDREYWEQFKQGFGKIYLIVEALEVYSQDDFNRESKRLLSEAWEGPYPGDGAWMRMTGFYRRRHHSLIYLLFREILSFPNRIRSQIRARRVHALLERYKAENEDTNKLQQ